MASYITAGYAAELYAQSIAAEAGYVAASEAAGAAVAAGESTQGTFMAFEHAYAVAQASEAGSITAGALSGAAGGFAAGFVGSSGNVKAGLSSALSGSIGGGINSYFGASYSLQRVGVETTGAGVSSAVTGGSWRKAIQSQLGVSALTYINWGMCQEMIKQSNLNSDNVSGDSHGLLGDRVKIGGARREDNILWTVDNADLGVDQYMPCIAPMGGCQGRPMQIGDEFARFGPINYQPGGIMDMTVGSFSGPHDWFRNVTGSYTAMGNSVPGLSGWALRWDTSKNFALVVPAGVFAVPGVITSGPGSASAIWRK